MQRESELRNENRFAALVTMFTSFFRQGPRPNAPMVRVQRIVDHPTSPDHRNIYLDPDPPTPHWGC
jgi:hypothetical protein